MTVEDYIQNLEEDKKEVLLLLKDKLLGLLPGLSISMDHNMPTFSLTGQPVFALAAQKTYVVLYVIPYDLMEPFEQYLEKYKSTRSALKVKKITPALDELLDDVISYCGTRYKSSALYNKAATDRK